MGDCLGQVVFDRIGARIPGEVNTLLVSCGCFSGTETTSIGALKDACPSNKKKPFTVQLKLHREYHRGHPARKES